jgi:hypothetical protein
MPDLTKQFRMARLVASFGILDTSANIKLRAVIVKMP